MNHVEQVARSRSLLFVPANRPDRFPRALAGDADVVIIDLEDAVAAPEKETARRQVRSLLEQAAPPTPVVIRINDPRTADGAKDLALLVDLPERMRPAGVMVSKADDPDSLVQVHDRLGPTVALLPLVETARGLLTAAEMAAAAGVVRLVLGHLDLCAELGLDPADHAQLAPARFTLVVASAAAGLPGPVDGVTVEVRNTEAVATDTRRSLAAGFTGKLCLHPAQVAPVHLTLAPEEHDLAWARAVVASSAQGAVAILDGRLIDRPVLLRAQAILARVQSPVRNT